MADADEKKLGTDRVKADTDGDGLGDGAEVKAGSLPLDRDSDDDALLDGEEGQSDGDGDGLPGALDADSDNDGVLDGTELGRTAAPDKDTDPEARAFVVDADPASKTNPHSADSDGDGLRDGAEDPNHNGRVDAGESDPAAAKLALVLPDADQDGLPDAEEAALGSDALDADTDDDGVPDSAEWNFSLDSDRDGARNVVDPDADDDGLPDGLERGAGVVTVATWVLRGNFWADLDPATSTWPLRAGSDGDGQRDGLEDTDGNGRVDPGEGDPRNAATQTKVADRDFDGLSNSEEARAGSDPDDLDTDDDGVVDGEEATALFDGDGDGLPCVRDPDSDDDGLADGTERGLTALVVPVGDVPGTDPSKGNFRFDQQPATRTRVLARDTDGDGLRDGFEDTNHNGKVDLGEANPNVADSSALTVDADGDGLADAEENALKSKASDADSDDDGIPDGAEANFAFDLDADGTPAVIDEDADGDGLFDGTEAGLTLETLAKPKATDLGGNTFRPDLDPASRTFPAVTDSDRGALPDGVEDFSKDGRVDPGETDPTVRQDDGSVDGDLDGDGLDNVVEIKIGTNPLKADSDGDTLTDATEVTDLAAPYDTDADGAIDALDLDADGDGVPDVAEARLDPAAVPPAQQPADSDGDGKADWRDTDSDDDTLLDGDEVLNYKTDPTKSDTDGGGLADRIEVLETKTNPLDPLDDAAVLEHGDLDGCPEQRLAVVDERRGSIEIHGTVHFAYRTAQILARSLALLAAVARLLNDHPEMPPVEVAGHTDERSSVMLNQDLSQKRAEAVVRELARRGVSPSRLAPVGYGMTRPLHGVGHDANRRVEFKLAPVVRVGGPGPMVSP